MIDVAMKIAYVLRITSIRMVGSHTVTRKALCLPGRDSVRAELVVMLRCCAKVKPQSSIPLGGCVFSVLYRGLVHQRTVCASNRLHRVTQRGAGTGVSNCVSF